MQKVSITGENRTLTGKSANKALRKEGKIPAIIYGGENNVNFSTTAAEVKELVYTPDFKLAEITLDGKVENCLLKDIQFHPVSDEIIHIDFLRLIENTPVKYSVPVKFKGVSPGIKAGGKLIQHIRKIKLKSTPENMVDSVYSDISGIELGGSTRVRDLEVADNITVESVGASPVAIVEVPRVLKSAVAEEGIVGGEEAVETEEV